MTRCCRTGRARQGFGAGVVTTLGSLRVEEPSGDSVRPTRFTAALQNADRNHLGLLPERRLPPF